MENIEINSVFGKWTVISGKIFKYSGKQNHAHYMCRCACGLEQLIVSGNLIYNHTTQCNGCRKKQYWKDISTYLNKQFGKWTVIEKAISKRIGHGQSVLCSCTCGRTNIIDIIDLDKGKSTGCAHCNRGRKKYQPYDIAAEHPMYRSWEYIKRCATMKYRLKNSEMCERWKKFRNFVEDMGDKPEGHWFQRIDKKKPFEPGNCIWKKIKYKE